MDSWYEMQPRQAAAFERQMEQAQMVAYQQAQLAPIQQQAQQTEFVQAWQEAFGKFPDLGDHVDAIMEAAQSAPEILIPLSQGTQADKQRVIENLYWLAKGRQADSLAEAATQQATQQATAEKAAIQAAVVAPASSLAVAEDKGPSQAESIRGTAPPSISEGLTYGR